MATNLPTKLQEIKKERRGETHRDTTEKMGEGRGLNREKGIRFNG